ncbi:MAG: hypothetical protein OEO83_19605, partial [Alphaproteobacteria bacterium]|nr:hypothetical protein [Alphaproteobacteria bacterium]
FTAEAQRAQRTHKDEPRRLEDTKWGTKIKLVARLAREKSLRVLVSRSLAGEPWWFLCALRVSVVIFP